MQQNNSEFIPPHWIMDQFPENQELQAAGGILPEHVEQFIKWINDHFEDLTFNGHWTFRLPYAGEIGVGNGIGYWVHDNQKRLRLEGRNLPKLSFRAIVAILEEDCLEVSKNLYTSIDRSVRRLEQKLTTLNVIGNFYSDRDAIIKNCQELSFLIKTRIGALNKDLKRAPLKTKHFVSQMPSFFDLIIYDRDETNPGRRETNEFKERLSRSELRSFSAHVSRKERRAIEEYRDDLSKQIFIINVLQTKAYDLFDKVSMFCSEAERISEQSVSVVDELSFLSLSTYMHAEFIHTMYSGFLAILEDGRISQLQGPLLKITEQNFPRADILKQTLAQVKKSMQKMEKNLTIQESQKFSREIVDNLEKRSQAIWVNVLTNRTRLHPGNFNRVLNNLVCTNIGMKLLPMLGTNLIEAMHGATPKEQLGLLHRYTRITCMIRIMEEIKAKDEFDDHLEERYANNIENLVVLCLDSAVLEHRVRGNIPAIEGLMLIKEQKTAQ